MNSQVKNLAEEYGVGDKVNSKNELFNEIDKIYKKYDFISEDSTILDYIRLDHKEDSSVRASVDIINSFFIIIAEVTDYNNELNQYSSLIDIPTDEEVYSVCSKCERDLFKYDYTDHILAILSVMAISLKEFMELEEYYTTDIHKFGVGD